MSSTTSSQPPLTTFLYHNLLNLQSEPYPHVPNPESCKKRASVALIIRIRPSYHHLPTTESNDTKVESLDDFFAQEWVQHGDPEVLFIKRATREGDRWTGHVALPGGKRDPEDKDDSSVAIRETWEEVGLDISVEGGKCLPIGNLPERVVRTSWGTVPIMVLCPFVFLHTSPTLPPLTLQPTEVASAHWVPLRVLLSPSVRTYEYVDVSSRYSSLFGSFTKVITGALLGKMRFSAVRLLPSESFFCSESHEFSSQFFTPKNQTSLSRLNTWVSGYERVEAGNHGKPLLLWGLTLGMLADFLVQFPPHNAVQLWDYPTFTSLDARLMINLLTRNLKKRNWRKFVGGAGSQTAMDSETEAVAEEGQHLRENGKGMDRTKGDAVGVMLDGYYDLMKRGVWIAAGARVLGIVGFVAWAVGKWRRV